VLTGILEPEAASGDEISNGRRHEHLVGSSGCGDPSSDVDGDPSQVVAGDLPFAGMDPGADVHPELVDGRGGGGSAWDCSGGPVERGEESVPRGFDLSSTESVQLEPNTFVMSGQQVLPGRVADRSRALGRTDDVREEHGRKDPGAGAADRAPDHEPLDL